MDFSIEWLREPETEPALGDLLCGLIRDIRLILIQPELGSTAKLAAITEAVDLLASPEPPGPQPPGPRAAERPGPRAMEAAGLEAPAHSRAAQSAALVVALLARNVGPATLMFEELAGEQVRIELASRVDRPLTAAESHELQVSPDAAGHHRTGRLRTASSGLLVAEVSSLVIPWRLPASARAALGIPGPGDRTPPPSTVPFGKALADHGVRREPLGARLVRDSAGGRNISVESSARMWLGDLPVALASERVTAGLCKHASARLARVRAATIPAS